MEKLKAWSTHAAPLTQVQWLSFTKTKTKWITKTMKKVGKPVSARTSNVSNPMLFVIPSEL